MALVESARGLVEQCETECLMSVEPEVATSGGERAGRDNALGALVQH